MKSGYEYGERIVEEMDHSYAAKKRCVIKAFY